MIKMNNMQKTWKIGFLIFCLMVLASSVFAALPTNLTFKTNMATAQAGQEFVVRLEKNPVWNVTDPFRPYNSVTVTLPAEMSSLGEPLTVNLAAYTDGPIYTWHLNTTQAIAFGTHTINVDVDGNTDSTTINISGVLENPDFTVSVPAITTQSVGNSFVVSVNIANGGGDATQINGYISAQKASVNATSFSVASIPKLGSETFQLLVTPNQYGTAILYVGISSYKKSDGTIVSVGHPDFDLTSSSVTRTFIINADPNVDFGTLAVYIGTSGFDNSVDLDSYVSDADTTIMDLVWSCSSTNPNITTSINALNHVLSITAQDGSYSGTLTCSAADSFASDSDSFNVFVNTACTESWSCSAWSACTAGTQTRTCTDLNGCGTMISKPAESQGCSTPSGGGGGGGSSDLNSKTFSWTRLNAGDTASMFVGLSQIAVSDAGFKVVNDLMYVKIKIESLKYLPEYQRAKVPVYQYIYFTLTNIDDSDIEYAKIDFTVPKVWLSSNNMVDSDVALMRYNEGRWDELPTEAISSDSKNVYFRSVASGLDGYFAVGKGTGTLQQLEELGKEETAEDVVLPTEEEEGISELGSGNVEEKDKEASKEDGITGAAVSETEQGRVPSWAKFLLYALILVAVISLIVFLVMLALDKRSDIPPNTAKKTRKR